MGKSDLRLALLLGVVLIVGSLLALPDRGGTLHGYPIPVFGGWILLLLGIAVCILSIRGILRGEGKPPVYTDKDVEDSKRRLEQMYIKEHGELPPAPRQDEQENSENEKNC